MRKPKKKITEAEALKLVASFPIETLAKFKRNFQKYRKMLTTERNIGIYRELIGEDTKNAEFKKIAQELRS